MKEITWKYYPWVAFMKKKNGVWKKAFQYKRRKNTSEMWLYGKKQDC